ncbi:DNA cytosine methyltransferase [Sphingomonas parapaucimobilis]|uniref:DNA cytosine methyltransferase n=1 Tax=Sphingomonas parapaucimobilis TaxID=28213 RepID=UPI001C3F4C53|nr:DNA cytosine methyltransferase [Sphingomonas parapaucimobilis]
MDLRTLFQPEDVDFRGLSFCAGYAGLDLGLHIAEPHYRTVGFVEREGHAAAALVARMEDQALGQAPIWDDLRSFDGRPWRGRVHLLTAGYPCQPFSLSGVRRGADDPRHLWPDIARIVEEVAPEWVFCENVEGHLSLGFPDVVASLQGLGYTTKAGLFTAREAGASHRRRRLFLLAHADRVERGVCAEPDRAGGLDPLYGTVRHFDGERRPILIERGVPQLDDPVVDHAGDGMEADVDRLAIFTPGPSELEAWGRLLSEQPDAQPAILREDDGLADWVERTRGAGNGVCSMAAALAWAVLKTAHHLDA